MKKWTTRKKTLYFAIVAVIIYALADMALTFAFATTGTAVFFDSTLTTEFFSFMKLISGLGGGLSAADIIADTITTIKNGKNVEDEEDDEQDEVMG